MKPIQVFERKSNYYGESDIKNRIAYVNPSKGKGIEYLDTTLHERNHITNPSLSEDAIIEKTKKQRNSYLSLI